MPLLKKYRIGTILCWGHTFSHLLQNELIDFYLEFASLSLQSVLLHKVVFLDLYFETKMTDWIYNDKWTQCKSQHKGFFHFLVKTKSSGKIIFFQQNYTLLKGNTVKKFLPSSHLVDQIKVYPKLGRGKVICVMYVTSRTLSDFWDFAR